MTDTKKLRIGMLFVFGILLVSFVSSSYVETNPQYTQFQSSFFGGSSLEVDPSVCKEAGQDFVIQIDPLGCEPSPVRSDLLEEQNVPVFCKLLATKVNPLIDVKAIDGLKVVGDLPSEVAGVGYQPSRAALGIKNQGLESSIMQDIGYAVIVLKQQSNESALKNCESGPGGDICYVEGELKTRINYDVKNAFGIGKVTHVLPQLTDSEWESQKNQYSFWNAKGFLRAEQIEDTSAVISIYDAADNKIRSINLDEGKTSEKIYLPGYTCLSSLEVQLNDLESPDTKIRLKVNDDFVDVKKGEKFLNDRCYVSDMYDAGVLKKATVRCKEDSNGAFSSNSYYLSFAPKVRLAINGDKKDYSVGDLLYTYTPKDTSRKYSVYLAYVQSNSGRDEDIIIGIISIPEETDKGKLTDDELSYVGKLSEGYVEELNSDLGPTSLGGAAKNFISAAWSGISRGGSNIYSYLVKGESVTFMRYDGLVNILGSTTMEAKRVYGDRLLEIKGFAEPVDFEFDLSSADAIKVKEYYDLAEENFNTVLENFASEDNFETASTFGEDVLYDKIYLNLNLGQKKKVYELCNEFKEKYPNLVAPDECSGLEISNQETSSVLVTTNGQTNKIALYNIIEPTFEEFGAIVNVRGPNGKTEQIRLKKNQPYYLEGFRGSPDEAINLGTEQNLGTIEVLATYYTLGAAQLLKDNLYIKYNSQKEMWEWYASEGPGEVKTQGQWVSTSVLPPKYFTKTGVDLLSGWSTERQLFLASLGGKDFEEGRKYAYNYLSKGDFSYTESIELLDLDKGKAKVRVSVWGKDALKLVKDSLVSGSNTLELDKPQSFGSEYSFVLSKVNIEKEAKVTLIPGIQDVGSQTNFTFKIGIEKRAIQLAPDEIRKRIAKLNSTMEDWIDKGEDVGKAVDTFKNLCLTGGTILVIKNFISNAGGAGLARNKVINDKGGWKDKCKGISGKDKEFSSVSACLLKNAAEIDKDVDTVKKIMNEQNKDIEATEKLSGVTTKNSLGQQELNIPAYIEKAIENTILDLDGLKVGNHFDFKDSSGKVIDYKKFLNYSVWNANQGIYGPETLRDLQTEARIIATSLISEDLRKAAKDRLISMLSRIQNAAGTAVKVSNLASQNNIGSEHIVFVADKNTQYESYTGKEYSHFKSNYPNLDILDNTPVQLIGRTSGTYLVILEDRSSGNFAVVSAYDTTTKEKLTNLGSLQNVIFKKREASSYQNNVIKNGKVEFYDIGDYKGLPAVVPFDKQNGWYVYIQPALPSGIKAYDASGKIEVFYLCNVGPDGLIDKLKGDDICQSVRQSTGPFDIFPPLPESQVKDLIKRAFQAVEEQSKKGPSSSGETSVLGQTFSVGRAAAAVSGIECQDFMSAQDCKILFNLCDPVMCPTDRCDFGGAYPVADPIQSGIIGSLVLCLPNFKNGVIVPICLSGVKAGIDAFVSTLKAYRDCLQVSLDTGNTVGACDELHSVYLCDFFWKQAKPLLEIGLQKFISVLAGESQTKGGASYLNVANSWDTAKGSMDYFVQKYASNAFDAFKARATDELKGSVCGNFVSGVIPDLGDFTLNLGEPASPPQFTSRLTIIPFSTVTNPPTSHYKVFYRIYAGESNPASYQVYLTAEGDSSYFRDVSGTRLVAQGTIAPGDTVIESKDFTAPTGYKKLCVNVNGQEECDFKEVSTSFATDFIKDKYIDQQATQTNINSEQACLSGTVSAYSLLQTPSAAAEELANPDISNYGIIRLCATRNPGEGTDPRVGTNNSRFREVGTCGASNLKCWLDTQSLEGITEFAGTRDNILSDLSDSVLNIASKEDVSNVKEIYDEVTIFATSMSDEGRLAKINEIIDKVFFNQQKATLYYARGGIYSNLAVNLYGNVKKGADKKRAQVASSRAAPSQQDTGADQDSTSDLKCTPCLDDPDSKFWCQDNDKCYFIQDNTCSVSITDYERCPSDLDTCEKCVQDSLEWCTNPKGCVVEDCTGVSITKIVECQSLDQSQGIINTITNYFTELTDAENAIIESVRMIGDCKKCGGTWADTNICDSIECEAISKKVEAINPLAYCQYNAIIRGCSTKPLRGDTVPLVGEGQAVA